MQRLQSFEIQQIFRKKIWLSELFVACLVLISLLAHFSGLKMVAKYRSEKAVEFHRYMRRYIQEDTILLY
jgi:steroid 5-alpha reductase family enzyme